MKIALIAVFFLLLTFTKADQYVYDTDGEILSTTRSYLIAIGSGDRRPYFTLEKFGKEKCPLRLLGASISPDNPFPLPVKVLNHNNTYTNITTEMPLDFTFVGVPLCPKTSKWFVELLFPDLEVPYWFEREVLFFGDDGNLRGEFYIQEHGNKSYKIVFCSGGIIGSDCGNVSFGYDRQHLVLKYGNVDPLKITFKRVSDGISMVV